MKASVLLTIFLMLPAVAQAETCNLKNAEVYINLISDLKNSINPINRFNVKYIYTQMRAVDIPKNEIPDKIANYTALLYYLHENITIHGVYAPPNSACNRYIYKISGAPDEYKKLSYVAVGLMDNKITNISFEEDDTPIEGKAFSTLSYSEVK
ncbi:MAG: hypothetical protein V7690_00010 [Shewanella sp.]|uniref:hypothetical protein n=1 Tax=unclassified Shewanella TaxID=196818 RepID=UPI0012FF2F28|nr:hypothetical protein [Shewanella sp. ALD9]